MQRHFGKIEALDDIGDVLWYVVAVCKEQGVVRQSYHFTPLFEAHNSERTVVYTDGFERDWTQLYDDSEFRKDDPIPERTMAYGAMLTWEEAEDLAPNTPGNNAYFEAMRDHGLQHGFGLPLFGPRGRDAYASFDFGVPIDQVSNAQLGVVRSVPQAGHQRVCVLLDSAREQPDLSERERQVLSWMVKGKSQAVIADILELSPDTIKTYAKRIYAKLGTFDRVGAVVKALKLGLVTV